jgi:hypothetical protein
MSGLVDLEAVVDVIDVDQGIAVGVRHLAGFTWAMISPPRSRTASKTAGRMLTSRPIDTIFVRRGGGGVQQEHIHRQLDCRRITGVRLSLHG